MTTPTFTLTDLRQGLHDETLRELAAKDRGFEKQYYNGGHIWSRADLLSPYLPNYHTSLDACRELLESLTEDEGGTGNNENFVLSEKTAPKCPLDQVEPDSLIAQLVDQLLSDSPAGQRFVKDNWQPIETAPKDWSNVILYLADEQDTVIQGYYDVEALCWRSMASINTHYNGVCEPTHWMPLPNPPSEADLNRNKV